MSPQVTGTKAVEHQIQPRHPRNNLHRENSQGRGIAPLFNTDFTALSTCEHG
jgi:hypothetical protein